MQSVGCGIPHVEDGGRGVRVIIIMQVSRMLQHQSVRAASILESHCTTLQLFVVGSLDVTVIDR